MDAADSRAAKKRRLAPKVETSTHQPQSQSQSQQQSSSVYSQDVATPQAQVQAQHHHQPSQHHSSANSAPCAPERHEFESYARHLQDAAMLIHGQTQRALYSAVSVLILQWEGQEREEDHAMERDLTALENVLRKTYNYRTERWSIPAASSPSPGLKLAMHIASFLEPAASDRLLIVYYTGHAYTGANKELFWVRDTQGGSPRLRWNSFRCLFDESPSDLLLLADSHIPKDIATCGSSGSASAISTQEIITASDLSGSSVISQSANSRHGEPTGRSFAAQIAEAFTRLNVGRPFGAEQLCQEIVTLRQQEISQLSQAHEDQANGTGLRRPSIPVEDSPSPVHYTLSQRKGRSLALSPLLSSQTGENEFHTRVLRQHQALDPNVISNVALEEPRVLVCTTYVGEASPDMSSFNGWLQNLPASASKITVEGMFLGPPTMLMISMPLAVWNVVQHDKVCWILGYVNSHNMTHLYDILVGPALPTPRTTGKDPEDGRIPPDTRQITAGTPVIRKHEFTNLDPTHIPLPPETPIRLNGGRRCDPMSIPASSDSMAPNLSFNGPMLDLGLVPQDDVEDSAEMQEAAEQLKALRHVRHMSDDGPHTSQGQKLTVQSSKKSGIPNEETDKSQESNEDDPQNNSLSNDTRPNKPRKSLTRTAPKLDTRCTHCSSPPFKDTSSLRKHVAAQHTRPFPCAFVFAGCTSTFGSKNEWKRHMVSQHLCLTYYLCSACSSSSFGSMTEGKSNEFNRKDLFTQHLRRMHAPLQVKKVLGGRESDGSAGGHSNSKLQLEWEAHVKEMQSSCLVQRRQPPQRSSCPKPDCNNVFQGPTSWEEWTEHVGRHMEKSEAGKLGVDPFLAQWALEEGIIERTGDGEYRLTGQNGLGGGGSGGVNGGSGGGGGGGGGSGNGRCDREDRGGNGRTGNGRDADDRTIVAASTALEKMDVDG